MAADVLVPQMGESVLEGTILEWKVKVGDHVSLNQPLVELMTDKVNVEIPAEVAGVLIEVLVEEGEVVPVGAIIARIEDGSGDTKAKPAQKASARKETTTAKTPQPAVAKKSAPAGASASTINRAGMSPKVKMMVREYSLDPATIKPTGPQGRVTVDDVERAVQSRSAATGYTAGPIPPPPPPVVAAAPSPGPAAAPIVNVDIPAFEPLPQAQRETRQPLQGVRKLISDHMVHSVHTSAHVTTFEDLDLTALVDYRNANKAEFRSTYGANLTFLPFIAKAVCVGLKEFPKMNASLTDEEIILKNFYNIGIAVAREDGLIVPVIKDADRKTIVELAVEIAQLGEKARTGGLTPEDVSGGTFSLTNAGMFGATASTPIIAQPQVAILGIHAIAKRPWVVDGEIVVRDVSTFGLSFDHRLIDGHTAVQFLHRVHGLLADPNKLLMQLR
ncbi:MAG: 2-oxo acid dehydrogenase subunit E2 [candidate division Zixibacteria bacterium]|nr:2-oxo acid dehydrogenase subunit E2 [candidate division Zixibacteria bacterium]MDH3937126.1 2-oxo acid dehydrogenase subunit E2 [candidate division Zixibacteria bacterium]MDH4034593.1 2-oxo acid dehydrogenase subunit E2 [candidate division Zixibacteria bacterium]